jgi:hypothetical protein
MSWALFTSMLSVREAKERYFRVLSWPTSTQASRTKNPLFEEEKTRRHEEAFYLHPCYCYSPPAVWRDFSQIVLGMIKQAGLF